MPNVASVLKQEITRLAKKQVREHIGPLKKSNADLKRAIAALKRENKELQRRLAGIEKRTTRQSASTPAESSTARQIRFSPGWVAKDRARLELSRKDYAALVGVSPLTIFNWEKGKSRPQRAQLEKWSRVRALGKREAWNELD